MMLCVLNLVEKYINSRVYMAEMGAQVHESCVFVVYFLYMRRR